MKIVLTLLLLPFLFLTAFSQQNVGIGISNPKARLQISGTSSYANPGLLINSVDVNGANYIKFERPGVRDYNWSIMTRSEIDPTGQNNGMFFYHGVDSVNSLVKIILNLRGNGRVGIGNVTPTNPLTFMATTEKKISLYPGTTGDAGFGVFANELRHYIDDVNGKITFGYDNFTNGFTERMRINASNGYVGMGTSDPSFQLDVASRIRIRGLPGITAGIWFNKEDNSDYGGFMGMRNNQLMGFYGNVVGWGFQMNTENGNIGIGVDDPHAPLHFANTPQNRKIVLFESANTDHQFYGFGVNASTLRYQTPSSVDDHVFYSGNGIFSSKELMRIKGNGFVGIGAADPDYKLDIDGRMRIRGGGSLSATAGIWLNNTNNTGIPAFIGMQNDNTLGIYGSGAGWGLGVNTDNGAITVAGNSGAPGQVLKSNGNSSSPGWTNLGNLVATAQNKGTTGVTTTSSSQLVPGSNITITVAVRSRLIYSCNVSGTAIYCFGCSSGQVLLTPQIDNTPSISTWNMVATNEPLSKTTTTISNVFWDVNPGIYTLTVRAQTNPNFRPLDNVTSLMTSVIAIPID